MDTPETLSNISRYFSQTGRIRNDLLKLVPKITQLDNEICAWALQYMKPSQAFANALVMSQADYSSPVIGYVILPNGNVIEHAWNADNNSIFDLTGQLFWPKSIFHNCTYLEGIRLDPIEAKISAINDGIQHAELSKNPRYQHMFNQ